MFCPSANLRSRSIEMRTKRALPRIPRARNRNRSESAHPASGHPPKGKMRWALSASPIFVVRLSWSDVTSRHEHNADREGEHHGHGTGPACLRARCHLRRRLAIGGEEAAHFARRLYRPRRRQGPGGRPGRPARRRRGLPAGLRPPPPAGRRQGAGVQHRPPTTASRAATPSCRSSTTTCRSWSIRSPTSSIAARSTSICWPIRCWRCGATSTATFWASPSKPASARKSESMMHIEIDRQADPALLDELAAALDARAGRGAAGGRGLAGDAPGLPRRHRRSRRQPLAEPRRVRRFPALAGGQPFHLPRPSPLSLRRGRRAARRPALRARAGLGARHPAPRRGAAVRGRPGRRRGDVALRPRAAATS